MSTATRLRRLDENAQITVLERSGYVSYANCGLPYHIGDVITDRDALLLQTPESLHQRFNIDVRVDHDVAEIDRDAKVVRGTDLETGESFEVPYDSLVLSPGAQPIQLPIDGIEQAYFLRNIEDTDELAEAAPHARNAVVIGGGFIGLEVAENLRFRGMDVTLVEATNQVMAPLDPEMISPVHDHLNENGVQVILNDSVAGIDLNEDEENTVELGSGQVLTTDLVVSAVGVKPETRLAEESGLNISDRGAIAIDDHFRTSDPNIYALGDAADKQDALTGERTTLPLAGPANRQGRRLADILAGHTSKASPAGDRPVLGTSIVKIFDLEVGATGWNEKRLQADNRPYLAIHTHPSSHAGYYPGAAPLSLKLLVDPETDQILGAQGVGAEGIAKRIDVIATAMHGQITASGLSDLELAYAPPFNSAKDPVNMLGYLAEAHQDHMVESIQWHELQDALDAGATLLDVRSAGEVAQTVIPASTNCNIDNLREYLDNARDDDPLLNGDVIVHCAVGMRGYLAARLLTHAAAERGTTIRVRNLDGGYRTWEAGQKTKTRS